MSGVFIHLVPGSVLLLPDDDFTVVGTGSQNVAEHRVSPRYLPNGTLVATQKQRPTFSSHVTPLLESVRPQEITFFMFHCILFYFIDFQNV